MTTQNGQEIPDPAVEAVAAAVREAAPLTPIFRSLAEWMRADWEGGQMAGLKREFDASAYMNSYSLEMAFLKLPLISNVAVDKVSGALWRRFRGDAMKDYGDPVMVIEMFVAIATQAIPGISKEQADAAMAQLMTVLESLGKKGNKLAIFLGLFPPLAEIAEAMKVASGGAGVAQKFAGPEIGRALMQVRAEMNALDTANAPQTLVGDTHAKVASGTPSDVVANNTDN